MIFVPIFAALVKDFFFCRQIFHLVFISSVRYKVIIVVLNFRFLDIFMFWTLLGDKFTSRLATPSKRSLSRA